MNPLYPGNDFNIETIHRPITMNHVPKKLYYSMTELRKETGYPSQNIYWLISLSGMKVKHTSGNRSQFTPEQYEFLVRWIEMIKDGYSVKGALRKLNN